jgi:two-component system, cell cycle response regulator
VAQDEDTAVSDIARPIPVAVVDDCLVVVHQRSGPVGRCIKLSRFPVRIGRELDNELVLDEDGVSRRHARLERRGLQTVLMDTSSKNGTLLNDKELDGVAELRTGDRIKIGPTVFKYLSGADPDAELHEQIYLSAITDELTGLRNKRFFGEALAREFSRALRYGRALSLLVIDIDHFKRINDTYGHHVGDVALRSISEVVRSGIRSDDVAARYGGEEIVVLLPETDLVQATAIAERMRSDIAECEVSHRDVSFHVTVSVGCAELRQSDGDSDAFFQHADQQMYAAKNSGRNCVKW